MRKVGLWLSVMALVAGTCGANAQPSADAYPNQTVRIVVPFGAGSNTDGQARILADKLSEPVEAAGDRREPSGHRRHRERREGDARWLHADADLERAYRRSVVNKKRRIDPVKDFRRRDAGLDRCRRPWSCRPTLPANNLNGTVACCSKARADELCIGGHRQHVLSRRRNCSSRSPRSTSSTSPTRDAGSHHQRHAQRHATLSSLSPTFAAELIDGKKIKVLAVSDVEAEPALPDVPTVEEAGLPDYVYDSWFGVMAPAGTPRPILNKVTRRSCACCGCRTLPNG